MNTEKVLNELIAKYAISDEDVALLEEAMEKDGLIEAEAVAEEPVAE